MSPHLRKVPHRTHASDTIALAPKVRLRGPDRRKRTALLFHEIADNCPVGMLVLEADGRILYNNTDAQRLLGLSDEQCSGRDPHAPQWQVTDFDGSPIPDTAQIFHRVLHEGLTLTNVPHTIVLPKGEIHYLHISGQPTLDRRSKVHHAVFTLSDVSASVTSQRAQRHIERALHESEQRFAGALEHAPIGMTLVSLEGRFTMVNQSLCRITGYSSEELLQLDFQTITHPDDLQADLDNIRQLLAGEIATYQMRKRYVRKNGSLVWVRLSVSLARDEQHKPLYYIAQIQDVTEEQERETLIQHIALHDALTGLPNRVLFNDRVENAIEQSRRTGKGFALMMIDLDHFKRINDSLGHNVGDDLLSSVAHRLRETVRDSDTVARMGGDEFVVLLPEVGHSEQAAHVADGLVKAIGVPLTLGEHDLVVSASIGIALYPEHGSDRHTLVKNADAAMYKAKSTGRAGYMMFSSELAEIATRQFTIEAAIRHGLRQQEFRVHYQPQVDLNSGQVVGMEALLRWQRGDTMIPPSTFIPVAEQSGLIQTLDEWVLRTAMQEIKTLSKEIGQSIRLAVNLSPQQLQHPQFRQKLRDMLDESGFDPKQLEIEITEGLLIDDLDLAYETLWGLRKMGISVALDDFGTGYSSLSYLSRFPIDTLKIDRSFIIKLMENTSDRAVVLAILAMAKSLKLRVIAEGVETAQQLAFLRTQHKAPHTPIAWSHLDEREALCVQGYHFSHALDLQAWMTQFHDIQNLSQGRVQQAPALLASEGQCVLFN